MTLHRIEKHGTEIEGGPEPSRILHGTPVWLTSKQYESSDGTMAAGVWKSTIGKWRVNIDRWEYMILLSGQ